MQTFCKEWVYTMVSHRRKIGKRGVAVALFVENCIHFKPRPDLDDIGLNSFVSIFIEIKNRKKQGMVIVTISRPPDNDINLFNASFDLLLTKFNREETKYILAGDYNIIFLHYDKHSETNQFLNHVFSNSCFPAQSGGEQGLVQQPLL